jgi:hypothetical protein
MVGFSLQVLCIHYMKCDIRLRVTLQSTVGQSVLVLSPSGTHDQSLIVVKSWSGRSYFATDGWSSQSFHLGVEPLRDS